MKMNEAEFWEILGLTQNKAEFLLWATQNRELPQVEYSLDEAFFILTYLETNLHLISKPEVFDLIAKCRKILFNSGQDSGFFDAWCRSEAGQVWFTEFVKKIPMIERKLDEVLQKQGSNRD